MSTTWHVGEISIEPNTLKKGHFVQEAFFSLLEVNVKGSFCPYKLTVYGAACCALSDIA